MMPFFEWAKTSIHKIHGVNERKKEVKNKRTTPYLLNNLISMIMDLVICRINLKIFQSCISVVKCGVEVK